MNSIAKTTIKVVQVLFLLFVFLVSIKLLGTSFKLFGKEFASQLVATCSNPFLGLFIGILTTTLVQSSSATTSMVVGLVGGGVLPLGLSIPIIMGANIGTTVTNSMVSFSFVTRRRDFRRAFAGATVHDFFNLFTVLLFFPIEIKFHIIEKSAVWLTGVFSGAGGLKFTSPLKVIIKPVVSEIKHLVLDGFGLEPQQGGFVLLAIALAMLFFSLVYMVKSLRTLVIGKVEAFVDRFLFRNDFIVFFLGIFVTIAVQSSSITTSMAIPLVGAGILTLQRCYPLTLGANIGTTCTALLASMATVSGAGGNAVTIGVTAAFAHLLFNIFGIMVFYPLKRLPIWCSMQLARYASYRRWIAVAFVLGVFYVLPAIIVFVSRKFF